MRAYTRRFAMACLAAFVAAPMSCEGASAQDRLLAEAVSFTGALTYLNTKVPGFLLVAVRNGEMAFAGFGTTTDTSGRVPDPDTMFRIGSISKVFCGEVLASLVLDGDGAVRRSPAGPARLRRHAARA